MRHIALNLLLLVVLAGAVSLSAGAQQNNKSRDSKLVNAARRPTDGKFLMVDVAKVELAPGDLTESVYLNEKERKKGRTARSLVSESDYQHFSGGLANQIYEIMVELDYIDTSRRYMPNYKNSLKLNVAVKEVHVDLIRKAKRPDYTNGYIEVVVEIELLSHYGKPLLSKKMKGERGPIAKAKNIYGELNPMVDELVLKFIGSKPFKEKVSYNKGYDDVEASMLRPLTIQTSKQTGKLTDWREAVATVITENGHGSACVISADGYLVTNFHVVEYADKVTLRFIDGEEVQATVERKHPEVDLALLKTDKSGLKHLAVSFSKPQAGDPVFVIGTPQHKSLGQSVSKGVISGSRDLDGLNLIQTDAKVNGGNSGGALLTADGKLIGIVSAKWIGYGIEGIGFAVPTARLQDHLNLDLSSVLP